MNRFTLLVSGVSLLISPITFAEQHPPVQCGDTAQPLLSVADFNADGSVSYKDIIELSLYKESGKYYAMYDRNADGLLDDYDLQVASNELGKSSTSIDRKLARLYQKTKILQTVSSPIQLQALGFSPITSSLSGHGVHWMNIFSDMPVTGINVLEDGSAVKAVYFSKDALPLFSDETLESGMSPLDYPSIPGVWMDKRVQAFSNLPPVEPDVSLQHKWHSHAGLCITEQDNGSGAKFVLDQHTSFTECQAIPNTQAYNIWVNVWMLHVWLFDLNPGGTFAGMHPCVDPDAPSESDINGDREIPPFFMHHE